MPAGTFNYTTGPSPLPDLIDDSAQLSYNGCRFSPLFTSKVSGKVVQDEARRTTKYMEYIVEADGYVTLPAGATNIAPTMANLCRLLTAQGGTLVYLGRGMDLVVNAPG
jgi:hypothetical protein